MTSTSEPQAWTISIDVTVAKDSLTNIREWLEEYGSGDCPRTASGQIASYIRLQLLSNSQWEGIDLGFEVKGVSSAP